MTTLAAEPAAAEIRDALRRGAGWDDFPPASWPALFDLVAVAADLPRLAGSRALAAMPEALWPELRGAAADLVALQTLLDHPEPPPGALEATCHGLDRRAAAEAELERDHCTTVDYLFDADDRRRLDAAVAELAKEKLGSWGELARDDAPALFALFDRALGSERFRALTGFRLERDVYTLTLSLQDLDAAGIGWHRDLYWPREWVGEDVFPVLYGLSDDSPEKGGAFLYYVPWTRELRVLYRRRHQATVMWNAREDAGRILHAVSGYRGADTARHLVILQCLRRR